MPTFGIKILFSSLKFFSIDFELVTVHSKSLNNSIYQRELTLSTSLKTRKKLSPANFLRSSRDHIPLAIRLTNSAGYFDTSSRPDGVLERHQEWTNIRQVRQTTLVCCDWWIRVLNYRGITNWSRRNWLQVLRDQYQPPFVCDWGELQQNWPNGFLSIMQCRFIEHASSINVLYHIASDILHQFDQMNTILHIL